MNEKDEGKRSPLLAGRRYVYSTLKDACEEGNEWEGMLVYESVEGRRCRRDREGGDARLHRSSRSGSHRSARGPRADLGTVDVEMRDVCVRNCVENLQKSVRS